MMHPLTLLQELQGLVLPSYHPLTLLQELQRLVLPSYHPLILLQELQGRYEYSIVGHSGETDGEEFVSFASPPRDRGDRLKVLTAHLPLCTYCALTTVHLLRTYHCALTAHLPLCTTTVHLLRTYHCALTAHLPCTHNELKVLQRMVTHSQFCMSGDNTIQATTRAMRAAAEEAAIDAAKAGDEDEGGTAAARNFVFVLSDANFRRYGLEPLWWAQAFDTTQPGVEGYAVMVGSLGDEAAMLPSYHPLTLFQVGSLGDEAAQVASALPVGRGYVCEDADDIPRTFAHIFRHARIVEDGSF